MTINSKSNVKSVRIEKVIIVKSSFGKGTAEDVSRLITEIYDLEGNLIVRIDDWENNKCTK